MQDKELEKQKFNMEIIKDEIRDIEKTTDDRFKNIDGKLNMLLVFNAGLMLLMEFIKPLQTEFCLLLYLRWTAFIIFICLNLSSIIFLFLGMKLRSFSGIDVSNIDSEVLYNQDNNDLLHNFITKHKENVKSKRKAIDTKQKWFKVAMILNIINVCVSTIGIILNLI